VNDDDYDYHTALLAGAIMVMGYAIYLFMGAMS
jgi:hypothetical protein